MGRTAGRCVCRPAARSTCSYCIIPTTRGASRSRRLVEVTAEVGRRGGRRLQGDRDHGRASRRVRSRSGAASSLLSLLQTLTLATTDARGLIPHTAHSNTAILFRVSSLEPMDFPDARLLDFRRVAPHLHLPLQHASNACSADAAAVHDRASTPPGRSTSRARLPHAAIGSDVIVGFPGETDEDFDAARGLPRRSPLTHLHVFPYSDRPGTAASGLPGKVHGRSSRRGRNGCGRSRGDSPNGSAPRRPARRGRR